MGRTDGKVLAIFLFPRSFSSSVSWVETKTRRQQPSLSQHEASGTVVGIPVFPETGKGSGFLSKTAHESVEDFGCTKVQLKSRQEPAIVDILRRIKVQRRHETLIVHSLDGVT